METPFILSLCVFNQVTRRETRLKPRNPKCLDQLANLWHSAVLTLPAIPMSISIGTDSIRTKPRSPFSIEERSPTVAAAKPLNITALEPADRALYYCALHWAR
ncbi:unnamed protein product [Caretta caretta]